jgi:outer membrane immunogenic protein
MSLPCFRRRTFGAALAALAIASGAADAADLFPSLGPVRGYSWQGPYVGVNLGYQWGTTTNNPTEPTGVAGGLQAGYNFQSGPLVFGVETDLQISGAEDRFAPWKFSNPWFGTLRGRGGYAMNNILFFGTVGLAYGTLRAQNTLTGASQSSTDIGWTAGAGMEVGLTRNWTARTEYLYVDLTDRPYAITGVSNGLESHLLRLGVNFRF